MKLRTVLLSLALGVLSLRGGHPLSAQEGAFAFQIRGGMALPTAEFRDAGRGWEGETGAAPSFGMGFTVPFPGPTDAYLGFSQHRFACDERLCPEGKDWTTTGFDVAVRMVIGRQAVRPWIQAGLRTHRMEVRLLSDGGSEPTTSEGGVGAEIGGGVLVRLGQRTSISPGIRYGEGTVPFPGRDELRVRYLVVDLGLVLGF